ncbi:unnamed protein product [Porites evermanni]|uniref:SH3 domain-binding protein 5-like n=1 Tax=Porites evermanni TaxID=104178 RepID=A0ABN8M1A3_9CNID|nr:unnamed protein product [Porites evermanni]
MAASVGQDFSRSKEQLTDGDGDGDEDDDEEILDPRVKGELDRLNSSTAEINRLEQDLEELRATFRQTLTESAYVLKSQSAFLGNCVKQARPYYDAVRKAKQSRIETQNAALKYERACSSHQAAKKVLAMAEQKLVSTSKEHKVLDPTWQEMLNQAVLKVMESDKERVRSEKDHLQTARAFSEAGNKVKELRTKLKSAINKSRPYFDLKMKYDSILEEHKRQVEFTQESLQKAKRKYSLALKNLEGISEEIHEMRRSRESLDIILTEREEGVGAESPIGDLSHDVVRTEGELSLQDFAKSSPNNPMYGFKIAVVSASREDGQELKGQTVLNPMEERDGVLEGCSALDEQELNIQVSKHEELSWGNGLECEASICQDRVESSEEMTERCSDESALNPVCQDETESLVRCTEGIKESGAVASCLPDHKQHVQLTEVDSVEPQETCFTAENSGDGDDQTSEAENVNKLDVNTIEESVTEKESITEEETADKAVNEKVTKQLLSDRGELSTTDDNEDRSGYISETVTESADIVEKETTIETGMEPATKTKTQTVTEKASATATEIVMDTATTEAMTEPATLNTTVTESDKSTESSTVTETVTETTTETAAKASTETAPEIMADGSSETV